MSKKKGVSWTVMLTETGVRERIKMEFPDAVALLDYLATRKRPFIDGTGWTVFNDWLDECWYKGYANSKRPAEIPWVPIDNIRQLAFPACR